MSGFIRDEEGLHLPSEMYVKVTTNGREVHYCTARQVALHVLGLDRPGVKIPSYHRRGKGYQKANRNYFGGHSSCLDDLVSEGFMNAHPSEEDPSHNYWYSFNDTGLAWMAREIGVEKIIID
ncbi:MAG: hypothetical protein Q4B26_00995 [Eubacteriales bacterium]|nr:hypothetical protein [Eubacteriales bacterium]